MKKAISRKVLLSFPDYTKRFELYVDASDLQIGAVLKQGNNTLAFFSKKLSDTQKKYGVGEREMLSIVEALKEFHTMIYGYPIDVYTDHLNWTYDKNIRNARVMRWRLLIQEYAPTLHYVQGKKNVVADLLSRAEFEDCDDQFSLVEEIFDLSSWRRFNQPPKHPTNLDSSSKTLERRQVQTVLLQNLTAMPGHPESLSLHP